MLRVSFAKYKHLHASTKDSSFLITKHAILKIVYRLVLIGNILEKTRTNLILS